MPRLIIKRETAPVQSLDLHGGVQRLGRREDNDFQIDDPTVSSVHCEIRVNGESVVVRDLGSSNGTFINGEPIREEPLQVGETLTLGEVETTPVVVAIPTVEFKPEVPVQTFLSDGAEACLNHPAKPAMQRCTHCLRVFCNACIHHLRRVGGTTIDLCPVCSHHCELLPGVKPKKKKSIFSRLQETLKFSLKH
jgi:hypothetical protein